MTWGASCPSGASLQRKMGPSLQERDREEETETVRQRGSSEGREQRDRQTGMKETEIERTRGLC